MNDEQLIAQGIADAERICAAAREFRQAGWPRVVDGCVAFHEGDRRFEIYDNTTLYVSQYLEERRPRSVEPRFWTLPMLLTDPDEVRELIEVITS